MFGEVVVAVGSTGVVVSGTATPAPARAGSAGAVVGAGPPSTRVGRTGGRVLVPDDLGRGRDRRRCVVDVEQVGREALVLAERDRDLVLLERRRRQAHAGEQGDTDERRRGPHEPAARRWRQGGSMPAQPRAHTVHPDRSLDPAERQLGDADGGGHPDRELPHRHRVAGHPADDHEDRPVVEVEPVRTQPDPHERADAEEAAGVRATVRDGGDQHEHRQTDEEQPAAEERRRGADGRDEMDRPHHPRQRRHRQDRADVQDPALRPQRPAHHRVGPPDQRERRTEQQTSGPRDRAHVERVELGDRASTDRPVGVRRGGGGADRAVVVDQRDHDGDRDGGEQQPAAHVGHAPCSGASEQQDHHDRPPEIELLLHREAPQVTQRGEVAGRGVAETHPDLVPVRHVERSGEHVTAELAEGVAFERGRPDRDEQHHHEHGGEESPGPAQPEVTERDPVVALAFGDQEQRDQVTGDDEEHLHAEEAAREPRVVGVVDHHRDDGERPETVEAGQVRHATDLGAVALGDGDCPRWGGGRHRPSSITERHRFGASSLQQVAAPSSRRAGGSRHSAGFTKLLITSA